MKQFWDRWAPLAGVLSVACSLVGVLFVLNQPQDKDSNAKIVAYFAQHSHQVRGVVGFFVFFAGILFLLAFLGSLRERLLAAEGEPGRLTALAFGAGIASLPLWGVSMLLAYAASFASGESSSFRLDPNLVPAALHDLLLRVGRRPDRECRRRLGDVGAGAADRGAAAVVRPARDSSPASRSCSGSSSSRSSCGGCGSS